MQNNNPFRSFIRSKYKQRGLHQYHLAEALHVDAATVSRWLTGLFPMRDAELEQLAEWLSLTPDERVWLMLAHDVLHAGPRVHAYVESLEADRFGNEVCDKRIEKLREVLGQVAFRRAETAGHRPLLYRPASQRHVDHDDETRG